MVIESRMGEFSMAVPGYQDFMYPFLKQLEDGKEYDYRIY